MPDKQEAKLRRKRALEWKMFRTNNLFTQRRLAEMIGVSRRTIQLVENEHITPRPDTLRQFANYKRKFDKPKRPPRLRKENASVGADLNLSAQA